MTGPLYLCCLLLMLGGVFGDTGEMKTVSVTKGESVTLHINAAEIQGDEQLRWLFNNNKTHAIASVNLRTKSVDYDERFKGRLQLDPQTGSLNITNIRASDAGVYKLEIRSSTGIKHKTFTVIVTEMPEITVVEGHPVTLHAGVNIQTGDVIQWKFKGNIIAQLTGRVDEGFKLNPQTGDLRITNIRRDQSGDYDVIKIKGSSLILHRIFRVNVEESNAYREETYPALLTALILLGIINTFMNE